MPILYTKINTRNSRNSETDASGLIENLEVISLSTTYMVIYVSSITLQCVATRNEKVNANSFEIF